MTPLIEARDIHFRYEDGTKALDGINFTLHPGETVAILGPNGSGKTTTVNMLIGLLEPTRGHIYFNGRDIRDNLIEYKRAIGHVPEVPYIYPYLTGREYLQLIGRLRSLASRATEKKINELMQLFGMHPHRH